MPAVAVATPSVPRQFQEWLQQLYCLSPLAPVDAFLLEGKASDGPTETLLLREHSNALELGLYLDPDVVARLEARGGIANFAGQSLEDFWTVLEGVSHFVCLGWHAERDREISALDLEIQAEIDKYVTAWEFARQSGLNGLAEPLYRQLFERWRPASGAESPLGERYRRANAFAAIYCRHLLSAHPDNSLDVRSELRDFFRLPPQRRRERIHAVTRPHGGAWPPPGVR
ncbi:MAG TPA: hypothetical protein VF267_14580 [Gammaproteobacteria bacterium]